MVVGAAIEMLQQHCPGDDIVAREGEQLEHAIFHLGDADRMAVDADQPLHLVDRQPAAAQRFGHFPASRFQGREQPRRRFFAVLGGEGRRRADQRLLEVGQRLVRSYKARAFLEAAARAIDHRFDTTRRERRLSKGPLPPVVMNQ